MLTNHRITIRNKANHFKPMVTNCNIRNKHDKKKRESTLQILKELPEMKTSLVSLASSLVPVIMNMRVIHVWDQEFCVGIPEGFDVYEGLRKWYPSLYEMAMEEENFVRGSPATPKMTDEEVDEAWAKYDYMEWLSD